MDASISQSSNWIDAVTALSTAAAAIFAAYSSWTSRVSATAAREAVNEAKLARQLELEPKLILEKNFLGLQFFWPHKDSLNGEAVYLAREHWKNAELKIPTLTLQNFGQSPAIEVTIEWELDTENAFAIPNELEAIGLSISPALALGDSPKHQINFRRPDGSGSGVPLYLKWTTDIPNSSPGQPRTVELPSLIQSTLFAKALEFGSEAHEIVLTAKIHYHSVDGNSHKSQFRWKAIPYWHYQKSPVIAFSHIFELPIYPKPTGPRVV